MSLPSIDEVFSTQSGRLPRNYVVRDQVDGEFARLVKDRRTIWLYGATKQGKSALRQSTLGESCAVVRCAVRTKLPSLYQQIFKQLGCTAVAEAERLRVSYNDTSGGDLRKLEWDCDPFSPQDVSLIIRAVSRGKYVIVEEFHYLPHQIAEQFSGDLKTWIDEGFTEVVVTAAGADSQRLTSLNGDLALRVESVSVDEWSAADLTKAVTSGFEMLGRSVSRNDIESIVRSSSGSIFLTQSICREVAKLFPGAVDVREATARAVRSVEGRCVDALKFLATGSSDARSLPYRVVARRMIDASPEELQFGIPSGEFRQLASRYGCEEPTLDALQRIERLQERKGIPVAVYRSGTRSVVVTDKIFAAWLQIQNKDALRRTIQVADEDLSSAKRIVQATRPKNSIELRAQDKEKSQVNAIRILHLSDIHFGKHYFAEDVPIAKDRVPEADKPTLFSTLQMSAIEFDVCVVSGDITGSAQQKEFREARDFIAKLKTLASKRAWNGGDVPVLVVPGNHDVNWDMAKVDPEDKTLRVQFYREFAKTIGVTYSGPLPENLWNIIDLRPVAPIIILGLSSVVVENPDDHRGYIGQSQVEAAIAELKNTDPTGECVRVAVFHHHIEPVSSVEASLLHSEQVLADAPWVQLQLHANRFSLLLHGHRHHGHASGRFIPSNDLVISGCGSSGVVQAHRGSQPLEVRVSEISSQEDGCNIKITPYYFDSSYRVWQPVDRLVFQKKIVFAR